VSKLFCLKIGKAYSDEKAQKGTELHHFQLSCSTCHEAEAAPVEAASVDNTSMGRLKGDINQLCTSSGCHYYDPMLNHPVGIRPEGEVPDEMPLDNYSRITCLTCHEESIPSNDFAYISVSQQRFLYQPEGIEFCSSCHMRTGGTLAKQSHWQFSTRAHLESMYPKSGYVEKNIQFVGDIDSESRTCLSCHEDVSGTVPAFKETPLQKQIRRQSMSDHPIGMEYERTVSRKAGEFIFPIISNQRIRLFNDRVGCGSCHSLYAQTEKNLVDRYERGVLCRQCHIK
jgi:predicted CXXCH cytochrome family protein